MPSMRAHALNPRLSPVPVSTEATPVEAPAARAPVAPPGAATEGEGTAHSALSVGGFHESSYELHFGLQVSESEWPDDVTLPGALDDS